MSKLQAHDSVSRKVSRTTLPKGISYSDLSGQEGSTLHHRFRVRDPIAKRYASQCFSNYEDGAVWAKKTRNAFLKGDATAATAKWSELGTRYVDELKAIPATPRYIAQVSQMVAEVAAAGARNITDSQFPHLFARWLQGRTSLRVGRVAQQPVPEGKSRAKKKTRNPTSPALKRRFLVIARAICQQAVDKPPRLPFNPLAGDIKLPRVPSGDKEVFRVDELRKLLSDEHRADPWWLFTVIATYTGCRATEVRHLRMPHFDLAAGYLILPASHPGNKAKRERRVPLQPELVAILKEHTEDAPSAFLVGKELSELTDAATTMGFQSYCRRCGVEPIRDGKGRGPHALRHTVAAMLTARGMSHFLVMDYLGHSSTAVAKTYAASADKVRVEVSGWEGTTFRLRAS